MEVNLSPNLFLSVEELNRLKRSFGEDGWKRYAKSVAAQFGIAPVKNAANFSPIKKSGTDQTLTVSSGIAFDADMNAIVLANDVDIELPYEQLTGDNKYWVIIHYKSTHEEVGTVSINSAGALTGNGTEFTKVLRGQPDFPTKVHIEDSINTGDYEVVSVDSDTSATLAGSFTAENGKKYSVVGTFTPGFIPSDENRQIYTYDDCEIITEISDSLPVIVESNEGYYFIVASVNYTVAGVNDVTMNIEDYRNRYLFNEPFISTTEEQKNLAKNKILSLVSTNIVSINEKGIMLECVFEHGFSVTSYSVRNLITGYEITISGGCNYIDTSSTIPNGMFKGWLMVNRQNMESCVIDDSANNVLSVSKLNAKVVQSSADIVLIPPFADIEYSVELAGNSAVDNIPYIFRFSIENPKNKVIIPILWGDTEQNTITTVYLKYRVIGSEKDLRYAFNEFNIAPYADYSGETKFLEGGSSIVVNPWSLKPVVTERNYS